VNKERDRHKGRTGLEKLFEPIKFGPFELENRVAVAAMNNMLQDAHGLVGMDTLCYYTRRVRGGFGLIISEALSNSEFHDRYNYYNISVSEKIKVKGGELGQPFDNALRSKKGEGERG
jgi:2,4-dienoyl-CoA reductase-like NADH-dependent reductase (Old Yellow Enzyme family)